MLGPTLTYLHDNRLPIMAAIVTVITAAIKTSPIPNSVLGKWVYDFSHQLFNITNTRLTSQPVITPPANKDIPAVPQVPLVPK